MSDDHYEDDLAEAPTVDLGFTLRDVVRMIWAALFAGLGAYLVELQAGADFDWKPLAVAAIAAVLSGAKNFVLADGSTVKG